MFPHAIPRRPTAGAAFIFATFASVALAGAAPASAQATRSSGALPDAWLQYRNDTNNVNVVPGDFEATWSITAPRPVRGLAAANGVIVVGTESADAELPEDMASRDQHGFVLALDAGTGAVLWKHAVPAWVHGDPAIYKGRVYVNFGLMSVSKPGGTAAFDLTTGKELWSRSTITGVMPGPAVDTVNQRLLIAGAGGVLRELALSDGTTQRRTGLRGWVSMSSPRVTNDQSVFVGASSTVSRYDIPRGAIRWRYRAPHLQQVGDIPVAITDGIVYTAGFAYYGMWNAFRQLPVGRFIALAHEAWKRNGFADRELWFQEQYLVALDRNTGKELWRQALGLGIEVPRNSSGTPAIAGGQVIVSSPISQTLHSFDAVTGKPRWSRPLAVMHKGSPTVLGHEMILGDRKGTISLLSLDSGADLGHCSAGSPFTVFGPQVIGRTLIAATKDGRVRAAPWDSVRARAARSAKDCF